MPKKKLQDIRSQIGKSRSLLSARDCSLSVTNPINFPISSFRKHRIQRPPKSTVKMPQAQPELKKVCSTPLHPYTRSRNRETRRTRREQNRNSKSKKESKWTDPRLQYLDKRLFVQLNGSRKVIGVLRGYDVCSIPGVVGVGFLGKVGLANVCL